MKASRLKRYPKSWPSIRGGILQRASDACECTGQCGSDHGGERCAAPNHAYILRDYRNPARWTEHFPDVEGLDPEATRVVLTVAHVDHDEQNNDPANLLALCNRCHLVMDAPDNLARRREREAAARGQLPFPTMAVMPEHRGPRGGGSDGL